MKNFIAIFLLVWCGSVWAETAYVIDNVNAKLRSGKGENYRTLRVLSASTEVEVIEADDDEFTKVKTSEGQIGWIKSSLLKSQRADGKGGMENPLAIVAVPDVSKDSLVPGDLVAAKPQSENSAVPHGQVHADPPLTTLLMVALGAFLVGVAAGATALRAYYLRRLHGLRI